MSQKAFGGRSGHTLDALCDRLGVDRANRVTHGALLDCELLAQAYPLLAQRYAEVMAAAQIPAARSRPAPGRLYVPDSASAGYGPGVSWPEREYLQLAREATELTAGTLPIEAIAQAHRRTVAGVVMKVAQARLVDDALAVALLRQHAPQLMSRCAA